MLKSVSNIPANWIPKGVFKVQIIHGKLYEIRVVLTYLS